MKFGISYKNWNIRRRSALRFCKYIRTVLFFGDPFLPAPLYVCRSMTIVTTGRKKILETILVAYQCCQYDDSRDYSDNNARDHAGIAAAT